MAFKAQNGQVALVLVLVITVVAAIVIAFAGRITTETRTQQIQLDTTQAMLAAESGLNYLINTNVGAGESTLGAGAGAFNASKATLNANQVKFQAVKPGGMILLDFEDKVTGVCDLNILWTSAGTNPGIFVNIINSNSTLSEEKAFIKFGGGAMAGFEFSTAGSNGFSNTSRVPLQGGDLRAFVTALGGEAMIGYSTTCNLPIQMSEYTSKGTLGQGESTVGYGIQLSQAEKPNVPEVFMNAVFSGTSLVQSVSSSYTNTTGNICLFGRNPDATCATPSTTGGTRTVEGNYVVHTFTSGDSFKTPTPLTAEVLLVGGGGGAGCGNSELTKDGGGGGGGGVLLDNGYSFVSNELYSVVVGGGGIGSSSTGSNGDNGNDSKLKDFNSNIVFLARGGGGGGSHKSGSLGAVGDGNGGGNGGGGGIRLTSLGSGGSTNQAGATGCTLSGVTCYGKVGGDALIGHAGGGGGSGGLASGITGGSGLQTWGGEFGKGGDAEGGALNGLDGTGNGGNASEPLVDSVAGKGGSGVVKIRYLYKY